MAFNHYVLTVVGPAGLEIESLVFTTAIIASVRYGEKVDHYQGLEHHGVEIKLWRVVFKHTDGSAESFLQKIHTVVTQLDTQTLQLNVLLKDNA